MFLDISWQRTSYFFLYGEDYASSELDQHDDLNLNITTIVHM
jgi:hypothetical protein